MLTTVAGFSALLTLSGAYRQLAFSLPVVIITCLIVSFLISLLVTPLTSYLLLRPRDLSKVSKAQKLADFYDKWFQKAFAKPKTTILCLLVFLLLCGSTLALLDFQIVPKADKDVVTVELTGNSESNLDVTKATIRDIEAVVAEQPEVLYYLSGAGAGIPRFDYSVLPKGEGDNVGDLFIRVDLKQGGRFKKTADFVEYLQNELDARIAGGRMVVDELGVMSLVCKPVEMKVFSEDLTALNDAADLVVQAMREVEGTKGIINSSDLSTYGFYVDMDSKNLNSLGLTKAEVQNELSIALLGRSVSLFSSNGKEYDIVLDSNIDSPAELANYQVKSSASGQKFALQQFAKVTPAPQLTSITRLDGERGRAVGCYAAAGYSNITLQSELEEKISQIDFPAGVRIEKSGEKKDFLELIGSIISAFIFSFVVIFLILMLQFNSGKKVALLFISVPFGVLAGIAGLFITGKKLALFALLGAIALLGCVLANAIVLVEYIDNERAGGVPVAEACRTAGAKRFRPILMSTTTTVLGLFPLAIGGDPLFIPMAILMMFGLAVSMVINLIGVPIVYAMLFKDET